jgi:hypothetical protein
MVSLTGILCSTFLGVVVQFKESSDQRKSQDAQEKRMLILLSETHQSVAGIEKSLSQLDSPEVSGAFEIPCASIYAAFCAAVNNVLKSDRLADPFVPQVFPQSVWEKWPGGANGELQLGLFFFKDSKLANGFLSNIQIKPDWELVFRSSHTKNDEHKDNGPLELVAGPTSIRIALPSHSPFFNESNGKLQSLLDLTNVTVDIIAIQSSDILFFQQAVKLKPVSLVFRFKNGRAINIESGQIQQVPTNNGMMYQSQLSLNNCKFTSC